MKKYTAIVLLIIIASAGVFFVMQQTKTDTEVETEAVTEPSTATTTPVAEFEKKELDLSEWKQFEDLDPNLFVEGSEFWYPSGWELSDGICNALSRCRHDFHTKGGKKNQYGELPVAISVYSSGGEDYTYPDGHKTYTFKAEDKFFKPGFVKIEDKTTSENIVLFDRPAKQSVRYYVSKAGDEKITEYTLEIDNTNGPRHYIRLTMDDTYYTNTEEIFNKIIARIKLGPIPEEDQQVIPVPPEFNPEA